MKRRLVLPTIREGKNKGYKHLYKVRRTLMRALEEYARRLLEEWFPETDEEIRGEFIPGRRENQQPDEYNLKLFKQFNRTEYGKEETGNV